MVAAAGPVSLAVIGDCAPNVERVATLLAG
jgi:hypothetical protein